MLFKYQVVTSTGENKEGTIESISQDVAISALQRKGLIVVSVKEKKENKGLLELTIFERVPMKDIVIMSRQISSLFNAQVPALKIFNLLAENTDSKLLKKIITAVANDIQAGTLISTALAKHPKVFSDFYVNMVKVGEESGKLNETFLYLADYLDRQYQLTSKTKNALVYPAFVIGVFAVVMILMFTFIIPKIAAIIQESGQEIPTLTKIVIGISNFFVNYWIFLLIAMVAAGVYLFRMTKTEKGKNYLDQLKISTPFIKNIYQKLYLSRISDNLQTMISAGIPIIHSIELTSAVIGNTVYAKILKEAGEAVKSGNSLSNALAQHSEVPSIMSQMVKVGEETGSLDEILKTMGTFYARELNEAVDTLVGLIEPLMIVVLGLGVGALLVSVLMPIYNVAGGV
ncbi:MAG: type II secretion system F family protein [Patescibacteria group bacterium]|nr:type II secretion system F family protein [Patescibacteria group bacterium]